jgi:hypothetical protein
MELALTHTAQVRVIDKQGIASVLGGPGPLPSSFPGRSFSALGAISSMGATKIKQITDDTSARKCRTSLECCLFICACSGAMRLASLISVALSFQSPIHFDSPGVHVPDLQKKLTSPSVVRGIWVLGHRVARSGVTKRPCN